MQYMEIQNLTPPSEDESVDVQFHYATIKRSIDRQQLRRKILSNISLKSKKVLMDQQKLLMNNWIKNKFHDKYMQMRREGRWYAYLNSKQSQGKS